MPTNSEGLTWAEWLAASHCEPLMGTFHQPNLKKAWREGEDPTEWRKFMEERKNPPRIDE